MNVLDWTVLVLSLAAVLALGLAIGASQKSQEDYFLASRGMASWKIAVSMLATQLSTISLIGAPAFVALRGGLRWLQYEFAVPLAMALMILVLIPLFYARPITTIYEILERRFGRGTRLAVTALFLASRGLASGAALYASSMVLLACLDLPIFWTIIVTGLFTLVYTGVGGIKADIYTDILQFVIILAGMIAAVFIGWNLVGGSSGFLAGIGAREWRILDFGSHGLGDGGTFSFWPMLFGGLFLYLSYYGCDQSQAQRLLTAKSALAAQKALAWNGLARFPVTLLYCFFGLILAVYLDRFPAEMGGLTAGSTDALVPNFMLRHMPHGVLGLIMAAFFAAGMSTMDSALNSLSAATMKDFLEPALRRRGTQAPGILLLVSRGATVFWGIFAIGTALWLSRAEGSVLEWVNMIGSVFYGPILGVFTFGFFASRAAQSSVLWGLSAGILASLSVWRYCGDVSWMWWNFIGFAVTVVTALLAAGMQGGFSTQKKAPVPDGRERFSVTAGSVLAKRYAGMLAAYSAAIIVLCMLAQRWL